MVERTDHPVRPARGREGPYHPGMDRAFDHLLTPRLVLRRFTTADVEAFARYRSMPEVARFQGWEAPFPLENAWSFVDWMVAHHPDEPGDWFQIAIALRGSPDAILGDCAFRPHTDEPRIADLGFTLDAAAQGHGYATEAIGELLRYLFEERGKHKVAADCDTRNDASWRLLERLGFVREGELRESFRDGEAWASEYLYGLRAADWRARNHTAP